MENKLWMHLNINFDNYERTLSQLHDDAQQVKPAGIYKELILYLKSIVDSCNGLIDRYFYLFEPNPHIFLALELRNKTDIELIKNKMVGIEKPNFIISAIVSINSNDELNGEAAIDYFYAGTKYAFFRISDNYNPGYSNNDEVKLVHCFANQLFVTHINEIQFYIRCLQNRGVSVLNNPKEEVK